jgi:bacterioferritin-associated ferredoxin
MIVCHCNAVSDRAVRASIVTGRESVEEISERSGIGNDCGSCKRVVRELLDQAGTPVAFPVAS